MLRPAASLPPVRGETSPDFRQATPPSIWKSGPVSYPLFITTLTQVWVSSHLPARVANVGLATSIQPRMATAFVTPSSDADRPWACTYCSNYSTSV